MSHSVQDLRVSLIQGDTLWRDPVANRAMYAELARPLAGRTDLVLLPETFTSGFCNEAIATAEGMEGPTVDWLKAQAAALDAAVTGSVQIRDGGEVYNRLLWATPDGALHWYDKRHLFRMAGEHQRYAAGARRLTVAWRGWRVCPLVCYDLRFPVFCRNGFSREVDGRFDYDLLLFVANWPIARRHAWRILLQARASENLCYVAAVNRVGKDGNGNAYHGDSMVVDFLGQPLVDLAEQPMVVTACLSAAALAEHRQHFPAQLDADRFQILD